MGATGGSDSPIASWSTSTSQWGWFSPPRGEGMHVVKRVPVARRRTLAVLLVSALLIPTWLIIREQGRAKADTVQSSVAITCLGTAAALSVTTTDVDPVEEGGPASLEIVLGNPALPAGIDPTVKTSALTLPLPPELENVGVTF